MAHTDVREGETKSEKRQCWGAKKFARGVCGNDVSAASSTGIAR